jgi:hypothetical protein
MFANEKTVIDSDLGFILLKTENNLFKLKK